MIIKKNKKSEVYIETSFRNQLPDAPINEIVIDETYSYLYSNALSTHCGAYKEFQLNQYSQANSAVEKMAIAYKNDVKLQEEVDGWTNDKNTITANLGYAIQLKAENPHIYFKDNYHFEKLKEINGSIEILGLSPWNDFHIFESINNANLDECIYYFYNVDECETVKIILPILWESGKLKFLSVKKFWEDYNEN